MFPDVVWDFTTATKRLGSINAAHFFMKLYDLFPPWVRPKSFRTSPLKISADFTNIHMASLSHHEAGIIPALTTF